MSLDDVRTDDELLHAWKAGDRQAGNVLFDRHFAFVARCFRHLPSAIADELIQETFLGSLTAADRFRGDSSFMAYLAGIARNLLKKHYRTVARDKRRFHPEDRATPVVADDTPSARALLIEHGQRRLLLEALRTLPFDSQLILFLFYWESLAIREIAGILNLSLSSAKSRLSRSRGVLLDRLGLLAASAEQLESTKSTLDKWGDDLELQVILSRA